MIPREFIVAFAFYATTLLAVGAQNSRSYDTNDWIPITSTNNHNIEKKAAERILHVPDQKPFSSEDISIRTKKSSNDQYLREISLPANRQFHAQPNPIQHQQIQRATNNFEPHLNQGEILNPIFNQPSFQQREELQRQQSLLFRQNSPTFSNPVVFPAQKPQFNFRQPFPSLQPTNVNIFSQNQQASPFGFQAPIVSNFNQSVSFEQINPGIQAINQGLSTGIHASSNNHFKEPSLQPSPEKPMLPADTVQLVYVPIDSLNQKQQAIQRHPTPELQQSLQFHVLPEAQQPQLQRQPQQQDVLFTQSQQNVQPLQFSNQGIDPHKQQQLFSIQHDFAQQALNALNLQLQLQQGQIPTVHHHHHPIPTTTTTTTTTTTPAPTTKKRKAHQPPLAVYMGGEGGIQVSDVLSLLKNAKTISVQDAVGPNSPQVFVGPQNLEAPEGYVKFDLPYLSSLETNRIERKVDELPFFVAPISYKAPSGYSKILLPAPHVGSVVVSQKDQQINNQNVASSVINGDSFRAFNEPQQTENSISEGRHRFDNQIQSSSIAPPVRRIPSHRPVLTQTINQYELEQINNQFVPQFHTSPQEVPTVQLENGSNEYEDANGQQEKDYKNLRFGNSASNNDFNNFNRVRTHKTNYVTTVQPPTSTERVHQFVEIETTSKAPERTHRFSPRPTHQQFINQYTVLEEFPINDKSPIRSSGEVDSNSSVHPTFEFPNQSQEYHPVNQESDKLPIPSRSEPLPTISSNTENNFGAHSHFSQFDSQAQIQNQFLNHDQQSNPTKPPEIINRHLLDPAYQLNENNQFVPTHSNHHISHKLALQQQKQEQEQANKQPNVVTSEPSDIQHFTEQSIQHANLQSRLTPRGREKPQIVSAEIIHNSNEAVDDYKLPAELPPIHPEIHSLINDLQDQSIRPLLVPASIAPTNNPISQQRLQHQSRLQQQPQLIEISSTEPQPSPLFYTSTTEAPTTTRRQRGRQRARVTTTTYTPRRTVQRTRKPVVRTTTEQVQHQPDPAEEYNYFPTKSNRDYQRIKSYREDSNTEVTHRPTIRPRTRTRARTTTQPPTTEHTTAAPVIRESDFKQSQLFSGFQASKVNPQSYMQFEHEHVPNLQYQGEQHSSTEPLIITKDSSTEHQRMNIEVLINHPITEKISVEPSIISEPEGNSHYVRFSSNLDSGVATRKVEETTFPSHVRMQGRGRFKSRATQRPLTTTTPIYLTTTSKNEKEEEFYGFFRPPNFNAPQQPYNPNYVSTTKRPVYISNTIQYEDQPSENTNNVNIFSNNVVSSTPSQFIGELVTKYASTTETTEIVTPELSISKPTLRSRIRSRMRLPKNKSKEQQQYSTTSSETRLRSRGKSHFTIPDRAKDESRDEDVEGGNYPKMFPKVESTTLRSKFQITIEPILADDYDDQVPFSSIRRPKVVPAEQAVSLEEVNYKPLSNDIPIDRKNIESQEQVAALPVVSHLKNDESTEDGHSVIMQEVISEIDKVKNNNEYIITTTPKNILDENSQSLTAKSKGRRRGVWKLVKRPVDSFETAESQYVGKINANSLFTNNKDNKPFVSQQISTENIVDKEITTTPTYTSSTTEEPDIFETFYKMFEDTDTKEEVTSKVEPTHQSEATTKFEPLIDDKTETTFSEERYETTLSPVDLRNTTYATTSTEIKSEDTQKTTNHIYEEATETSQTSQTDAWDLIKTSTATEISHETEICFRGKCVKSSDDDIPAV